MKDRLIETLSTLWRLVILFFLFFPIGAVLLAAACIVSIVTLIIAAMSFITCACEGAALFFYWLFTGRSWMEKAEQSTGCRLWSASPWEAWINFVIREVDRMF